MSGLAQDNTKKERRATYCWRKVWFCWLGSVLEGHLLSSQVNSRIHYYKLNGRDTYVCGVWWCSYFSLLCCLPRSYGSQSFALSISFHLVQSIFFCYANWGFYQHTIQTPFLYFHAIVMDPSSQSCHTQKERSCLHVLRTPQIQLGKLLSSITVPVSVKYATPLSTISLPLFPPTPSVKEEKKIPVERVEELREKLFFGLWVGKFHRLTSLLCYERIAVY